MRMMRIGGVAAMSGVLLQSGTRWTSSLPVQMTSQLHELAEVSVAAVLGSGVAVGALSEIGPKARVGDGTLVDRYVHVGEGVEVGNGVVLRRGSCVYEGTRIGSESSVYQNAILGNIPQVPAAGKSCEAQTAPDELTNSGLCCLSIA